MDNISTDTQSKRPPQIEVDYWSTIDRTDMELSGLPLKYHSTNDLSDALGTENEAFYMLVSRLRKRLVRSCDNIEQNG